jgi:hypothetical protein
MAVFIDPNTGERFENVPDDQAEIAQSEFGLMDEASYASKKRGEEAGAVAAGSRNLIASIAGPALAVSGMLGIEQSEYAKQQQAKLFGETADSRAGQPVASMVGGAIPAVALGAATAGAGTGLGATAAVLGGESAFSGVTSEATDAQIEGREFDLGNAAKNTALELAFGVTGLGAVKAGNLFLGGAGKGVINELPKGIAAGPGKVKKAVTAIDAASDEGVVDVMAQAAEGATKKKAKIATDLPAGPERAEALASTADVHYDRMATEFAEEADKVDAVMSKVGDTSASPMVEKRLRETIGEQSPAQMQAVTETTELAAAFRRELTKPLDEVVEEAPLKWADDSPPISGTQPVEPFKPGEGFNFETGALEPSAKPPKPAKPRTLATTNKLRGIATEIDTTIRNMTTKLDKSTDSVDWYLAMRKAKQEMQDTVRTLGNMTDKGDEVLHAKLQKMSDDFATHLKNELTKQEHWGKAAEIEAGINAAWHDKWLKGRLIAQNDLARKTGRQYRTGRDLIEYDPAKIRSFMKGDKVSRTVTQRHLDNVVDGWEDMAKVHELHGTASPADIKLLRDSAKRAREKMALVDEIQDAVAGRVTKKTNPYVEFAKDFATDLLPGGGTVRSLVKKGLNTETGKQITSAAYERGMSILKRRQGQTGAVELGGKQSPVDLSGKSLRDLGALDDPTTFKQETLASLRTGQGGMRDFAADFGSTGRVKQTGQVEQGIQIEMGPSGPRLVDGRHRLMVGREKGLTEVYGQVYQGARTPGKKPIYEGPIPIAPRAAGRGGERGFAEVGQGIGNILTSPIGLTSGVGLAGAGALGYAKSQRDLETQADRIVSTDESGKLMTKQTGRTLAGVGSAYNDRNSGEELPAPPTALGRFTEGYANPEASFEAKRKLLDAEQLSPTVLYEVMGSAFGDLPRMSPELFQQVAQRTAQGIRYMRENLPAGISTTLMYPNGTPPSRSALREWATMWNTFTDPSTVLDDINNGTAVPLQMQTLRDVHPDVYDQLRADVIEQVGTHFQSVPTSTKAQLDLLFQADGLAGPMWSSAAADQIGKAMAAEKEKGMNPGAQGGGEPLGAANGPGGIEAIQSSVTNKGG